ncbi:hypothetical protein E4633_04435 [Geomonas terrae]|uniref:Uncharacterized protein n=1 Tax=Geomonas terrae TaxID=2562681 RepID=A0A4S1CN58_9BACT|nr:MULTISPECIES: hypothetical protein [Geomonas]TGU74716.1 hypothetical protein E4633_04435 [Geomonas terrae]
MMEPRKKVTIEERNSRFRALGVDDNLLGHWHTLFERENPSGHESFQEWLGLPEERTAQVCSKSAESKK